MKTAVFQHTTWECRTPRGVCSCTWQIRIGICDLQTRRLNDNSAQYHHARPTRPSPTLVNGSRARHGTYFTSNDCNAVSDQDKVSRHTTCRRQVHLGRRLQAALTMDKHPLGQNAHALCRLSTIDARHASKSPSTPPISTARFPFMFY